jgi:hypothetical protein
MNRPHFLLRVVPCILTVVAAATLLLAPGCDPMPDVSAGHAGTILSIAPAEPFTGDTVAAKGYDFGDGHMRGMIRCGGASAKLVSWADTMVCFVVPDGAQSGTVEISCNCGGNAAAKFPIMIKRK